MMIGVEELVGRAEDGGHTVLDVRPVAAYNGWCLAGEVRGGHVPGARSLPLEWTRYMDWVEVVEAMGLEAGSPVTVYGYTGEAGESMAEQLSLLGIEDVDVWPGFMDWSADADRPLDRMARRHQLVHPGWLGAVLDGARGVGAGEIETPPAARWVVCHAHYGNVDDYHDGHIPGAVALDTNLLESSDTWNRRSPAELRAALESLGIRHDTTVVLYGRHSFPSYEQAHPGARAGHLAAMRCAAIMLYAGVDDVRVLNGGIHAWEGAGHELSTDAAAPDPVADFGIEVPGRPGYMVDTPAARRMLSAPEAELVSVRSWAEFIGERTGYHYVEKAGRIPGAVFGNCGSDAYHMENYRNLDFTTRAFDEVAAEWSTAGIVPAKHIAFYCGTGWRGSEAFMNAYFMGWPNISVYDGGWYEWSADPSNPIETGAP